MRKNEKLEVVKTLSDRFSKSKAIILAEYRGLKVSEMTEIRREIKKNQGDFHVVKNRLAKRAVAGSEWEPLKDYLRGPMAAAVSEQDPVVLAKLLSKYAESFTALKIKVGCLNGKVIDAKGIEALSKLPSKEELYAKLLGTLMAPASGLVRTLNGVSQKLVVALNAIANKKQ
ncbi:MAG: 50S ribosomal protein L10 [Deltaproteobacteria bacterium]|nr:50S ribosomal protein L10 [Deltaproteobacteria bacterium]